MQKHIFSEHAKYTTKNPISKFLVSRFFAKIAEIFFNIEPLKVLDVGCGEGLLLHYLSDIKPINSVYALDINEDEVNKAKKNIPFANVGQGSIYQIPFEDNFVECVICSEVLEHLEWPLKGIDELRRVTSKYLLISVPNEPLWRFLNMVRLKYWDRLGNTPDHLNHWGTNSFVNLLSPYFIVHEVYKPIPWIILLCEKKQ